MTFTTPITAGRGQRSSIGRRLDELNRVERNAARRRRNGAECTSMSTAPSTSGPLGQPRGIGFGILLFIVTLGIYSLYWVFKTQDEVKEHSGIGVGGVLGPRHLDPRLAHQLVPDPLRDREDAQGRRARSTLHGLDRALGPRFRSSGASCGS